MAASYINFAVPSTPGNSPAQELVARGAHKVSVSGPALELVRAWPSAGWVRIDDTRYELPYVNMIIWLLPVGELGVDAYDLVYEDWCVDLHALERFRVSLKALGMDFTIEYSYERWLQASASLRKTKSAADRADLTLHPADFMATQSLVNGTPARWLANLTWGGAMGVAQGAQPMLAAVQIEGLLQPRFVRASRQAGQPFQVGADLLREIFSAAGSTDLEEIAAAVVSANADSLWPQGMNAFIASTPFRRVDARKRAEYSSKPSYAIFAAKLECMHFWCPLLKQGTEGDERTAMDRCEIMQVLAQKLDVEAKSPHATYRAVEQALGKLAGVRPPFKFDVMTSSS